MKLLSDRQDRPEMLSKNEANYRLSFKKSYIKVWCIYEVDGSSVRLADQR